MNRDQGHLRFTTLMLKVHQKRRTAPRRQGPNHWLVAHREAERQRVRTIHRRIQEAYGSESTVTRRGATLDAALLLKCCRVDEPSQLCSVDVSEHRLNSVNPEDLELFTNVAYIDASINSLTLGSFGCFVALKELNLSLNGLCNVTFDAADFPHLTVLDLSYNSVSAQGAVSLGRLPRLKTLHLTGNQLHRLPLTFGSSHTQPPAEEGAKQFEALEVLMLDNNRLSSDVFHSLTDLRRLKYLNLRGNRISAVPHMKPGQLSAEAGAHTLSAVDECLKIMETFQPEDGKGRRLPLPELQQLNLAENKISTEEALISAALFPKLAEMDIHSNPVVTRKRGGLPVLTYYLQERRGVEIKRNKEQKVKKLPLKLSVNPKWKVKENPRKASKGLLLTAPVCPTGAQKDERDEAARETARPEGKTTNKDPKQFFITQTEDEAAFELVSSSEESEQRTRTGHEESTSCKTTPNPKVNPVVLKPVGIQTAVRMLEHTLGNLNVYRDSKPKLDSIQTPYREREKRIKELPPVRTTKRPSQRVDEMMKEVRASTTIEVVALGDATRSGGGNGEDSKEARSLLKDMMIKHKLVHEKAW
ncbi:X-ray radiation resistance-associated protein 1 isoform X2 [Kryptolebias marmoratus]|uniref:X-ray radiation resistance-associated protein 1 isoform X2 n=1 Tax=Kryptolebias marmoratus TaxID=37003 RepID=UPI000D530752|nr:X-ray radiation resistance-associated protein 1 isoform X2 [Kryptolebias marmoratus]